MLKVGIIGRSEWMYDVITKLIELEYEIPFIVTSKEAPEYKYNEDDFKKIAGKVNASFLSKSTINDKKTLVFLKKNYADIVLSVNYTGIVSQKVIDLYPLGILNAHGGDLPRYRGNACQAWAIINKENKIGLCIHKMKGGQLDSGDIITRDYLTIDIDTRVGEVINWMTNKIPFLMLDALKILKSDSNFYLNKQSNDSGDILRCFPRRPEDGKIDWNMEAEDVLRLINASSEPYNGAFSYFENNVIVIWRAELFKFKASYLSVPGQVCFIIDTGVVVSTGKGMVLIKEIQFNNKRMNPNLVIKSTRKRLYSNN